MGKINENTQSVLDYLHNTYNNYCVDYPKPVARIEGHVSRLKALTCMETLMVILGQLTAGGPLNIFYEPIPREMKVLGLFPLRFTQMENYEEFILRKANETIQLAKQDRKT